MTVTPDDDLDLAYPINCLRVGRAGTLRLRLADAARSVVTLTVFAGQIINLPVLRVFATGTTAEEVAADHAGGVPS